MQGKEVIGPQPLFHHTSSLQQGSLRSVIMRRVKPYLDEMDGSSGRGIKIEAAMAGLHMRMGAGGGI